MMKMWCQCYFAKRPVLTLDDGRDLIVEEDKRNCHVLKLTSQSDPYKRKVIKNWKELWLRMKSYIRIEMPIKIEDQQLDRKISALPEEQLLEMYSEVYNILNIKALEKMAEKYKEKQTN